MQFFHFAHVGSLPEDCGFQGLEKFEAEQGLRTDWCVGHLRGSGGDAFRQPVTDSEEADALALFFHTGNLEEEAIGWKKGNDP